jgi:hypothetical protein
MKLLRGIRVNVVSPPWVSETLSKLGMEAKGGLPASVVAQAYVRAVETPVTGQVIEPAQVSRGSRSRQPPDASPSLLPDQARLPGPRRSPAESPSHRFAATSSAFRPPAFHTP